jgi:hypothetical protein
MKRSWKIAAVLLAAVGGSTIYAYHTAPQVFEVFADAFDAYSEGYTLDRVVINSYEDEGDSTSFTFEAVAGDEYRIIAVGDKDVLEEPDLTVKDENGQSLGEVEYDENTGTIDFVAPKGELEVDFAAMTMPTGMGYGGFIVLHKD